ncbi:MAG: hypothetical protein RJA33_655 [Actinomycetota bacterium]|jgi:hypothetical protein
MSFEELIDRLKYRLDGYFHSEKRAVKALSRLLAFTLFAAIITTVVPTLADELSSDPSLLEPVASAPAESSTVTVGDSATASASPSANPTFSPEPEISRPAVANPSSSALPESSDSATANGPGVPLEDQPKYILKIPASGGIDPRAATYFLPQIYAASQDPDTEFTMACISGTGVSLDAKVKKVANNATEGDLLVSGDQSGQIILAGSTNKVVNAINGSGGLFINSLGGGLAGRSLTFRFVAVTKPVVDPTFCSAARSGSILTLRALGLDLSTVKGSGKLK